MQVNVKPFFVNYSFPWKFIYWIPNPCSAGPCKGRIKEILFGFSAFDSFLARLSQEPSSFMSFRATSEWGGPRWDLDRLESEGFFLFCSFSSLISFVVYSSVRWQCLHCPAAQSQLNSHSACFAQPLGPSTAAREGVCWNARTKAPLYLPACLQPGDHTGGTRGLSPLSFACTGLALCRHKGLLLVTQLWHYPRGNSYATIFFSLFHFVAALCQKGEAFQNIFRDLI